MIAWHLPPLYELTLFYEPIHIFEHLTFIGAGVVFWWPLLEATGETVSTEMSAWWKLAYLLIGTFAQDAVALVLMFSRTPFYEFYVHVPRVVSWLDPVVDQNLAGVVLMVFGKTSYAVAALAIFFRVLDQDRRLEPTAASRPGSPAA
jgi:cytochrome c oxidase assembly factor CtaG